MTNFIFTQADGSSRSVQGYKYAAPNTSAKRFVVGSSSVSRLPAKVDLRPFMSAVEQQGQTNSCGANATAGAYEYLVKRHLGEEAYDVSRLFIYYNARAIKDPENIADKGSYLQSTIESLKAYGACSEDTWTFDQKAVNEQPSEEAYEEAKHFLIEDTELVPTDLNAWKTALAEGNPIIFGVKLFGTFDKHKKPGLVPAPSPAEAGRNSHGGHAMLCVGYSDPDQVFIVRNSWGPEWGDKGYCYIPYRYLMNQEYNFGDSWIIKCIDVLPPDEETWADDEESMLEDVASVLANLDDETYTVLLDRMGNVPLEVRLALLFLVAAGADGDISEEELSSAAEHLAPVLEQLGSAQKPERILRNTLRLVADEKLIEETINIFGETFSQEVLASIASELVAIAAADDESEEEAAFVDAVIERWQIQPAKPMGEVPWEVRLALLFLYVVGADGDISPEELSLAAEHLAPMLKQLGSAQEPEQTLNDAWALGLTAELIEETIKLFSESYSQKVLASIAEQLVAIAGADGVSQEESANVDAILQRWQIQPAKPMGEVPWEVRLALLFLYVMGADGDISPEELSLAAEHLAPMLKQLGSAQEPEQTLNDAWALGLTAELIEETIKLFGEAYSQKVLASIAEQLVAIAAADGVSQEESANVDAILQRWQIQGGA